MINYLASEAFDLFATILPIRINLPDLIKRSLGRTFRRISVLSSLDIKRSTTQLIIDFRAIPLIKLNGLRIHRSTFIYFIKICCLVFIVCL